MQPVLSATVKDKKIVRKRKLSLFLCANPLGDALKRSLAQLDEYTFVRNTWAITHDIQWLAHLQVPAISPIG